MMDFETAKRNLIDTAKMVASDPSDENIGWLLTAALSLPFGEPPEEFIDARLFAEMVPGSLCDRIFRQAKESPPDDPALAAIYARAAETPRWKHSEQPGSGLENWD